MERAQPVEIRARVERRVDQRGGGSLAAGALGSQTGDSLYAPASAQRLVTLRATDGLQSGSGIMPLTWMMDFGGAMTRSLSDLADMLNVLAVPDPQDPATLRRPEGADNLGVDAIVYPAERRQPQRRRWQQGCVRAARHAERRDGEPDGCHPGRLQRPRTAD